MAFLLIIISWFVVGILSALWSVFYDLKHEKYNENYFDNDTIEVKFDEEGNRIYEEICLYAKWIKK